MTIWTAVKILCWENVLIAGPMVHQQWTCCGEKSPRHWSYGVMVSSLHIESKNPSSNFGWIFPSLIAVFFLRKGFFCKILTETRFVIFFGDTLCNLFLWLPDCIFNPHQCSSYWWLFSPALDVRVAERHPHHCSCGIMVSTLDSESKNPSSNLDRIFSFPIAVFSDRFLSMYIPQLKANQIYCDIIRFCKIVILVFIRINVVVTHYYLH